MGEKRSLIKTLIKRRNNLIGHILRHDGLMKKTVEGQVEGKKGKERPRTKYMKQVKKDVQEKKYVDVKRLAGSRIKLRAESNQS